MGVLSLDHDGAGDVTGAAQVLSCLGRLEISEREGHSVLSLGDALVVDAVGGHTRSSVAPQQGSLSKCTRGGLSNIIKSLGPRNVDFCFDS